MPRLSAAVAVVAVAEEFAVADAFGPERAAVARAHAGVARKGRRLGVRTRQRFPFAVEAVGGDLSYFYGWSDADSSAFNNTFHWTGRQVLDAGERLRVDVDGGSIWLAVSGYQLSTP